LIIGALTFAQNRSISSENPNPRNFQFLYSEINALPDINNNWIYYYTFRIPYNHLVFVKNDKVYNASFSLVVEVTDTVGNFIDRQIKDDNIRVNSYEATGSDLLFYQGILTFRLPKKNYNFLPLITDINSRDELKLKKIEILTGTEKYQNLLPPIVVNSIKKNCDNQKMSILTNYNGFIPFNSNSYDIIFPSIDTSLHKIKTIIINNEDTLFNNYLSESSLGNINIQTCDSQIVLGKLGEISPVGYFIIKGLSSMFSEGNLIFLFFNDDSKKPFVTQNRQCVWFDKPLSLMNPEFAIKILKYMTSEDSISKMLSVKEKNYTKELFKFWGKFDPTSSTKYNEVMNEYYKRVDFATSTYSSISTKKGFDTDRGKVYIQFGIPKKVERSSDSDGKIVETWYYDQKKIFVFVDKQGTGDFSLKN
jgi:GWxTD domain-containing protein